MKKKRSIILWSILLVILAGIAIGFALWNKPHPKAEDAEAVAVEATALYNSFSGSEQEANTAYLNKVLEVTGVAAEVSKNQDGKTVAVLAASDPLGGIQCTFRDAVSIQAGQTITAKGFCNGYTMVVLLNDCILKKTTK